MTRIQRRGFAQCGLGTILMLAAWLFFFSELPQVPFSIPSTLLFLGAMSLGSAFFANGFDRLR